MMPDDDMDGMDGMDGMDDMDDMTTDDIAAEGKRVADAIGPGSTRADSNSVTSGNQMPFTIDGGKLTEDPLTTGDDQTDDDFAKSDIAPAEIADWTGAKYTRTMGMVADTVYSYTDQEAATDQAYTEYYSNSDAQDRDGVDTGIDGVLTLSTDQTGNHELFSVTFGINAEDQTKTIMDDTTTTDVSENEIEGMFNGVPGTFVCDGTCTAASDDMGNLETLTGTWTFEPAEVEMGADPHMVAGVVPDPDYLDFGYWLQATEDEDGEVTYAVLAYADGKRDYGSVASVLGTAEYKGPATGIYMMKTFAPDGEPTPVASGQFTAHAMLTANFGGGDVAANDQFTVSGTVSNFMDGGAMINDAWSVELMKTASENDGTFTGATTGEGAYNGTFHGDNTDNTAPPSAASGTFDAHFANGHVLGAFGANIQAE